MEEEKIIKCNIYLDRIFFPKYVKLVDSGEYAIFSSTISKRIEGCDDLKTDSLKLKGNVCTLEYGITYKVYARLADQHEIYGDTYEIIYINKVMDISSKDKQKEYLSNVLNENLVEKLFDTYEDVIGLLENKDVESLIKVKGIGNQVALRLIDEYEESKDYSSIYLELGNLGFTPNFIKKLVDFYSSPDVVIDKVKNDPYDLVRIEGIGFKKADEVACKVGVDQFSPQRIKGFLIHHLNEQGEAGKSYLSYQDLMKTLYETLGFVPEEVIMSVAKGMMDNNDVVVTDGGNNIALKKYYDLETRIADELIRLQIGYIEVEEKDKPEISIYDDYIPKEFDFTNWRENIYEVEEEQGYDFTDEQIHAIELSTANNVIAITGGAGTGKTSTANGICSLFRG